MEIGVYLPDDIGKLAIERNLPVSRLLREAIEAELRKPAEPLTLPSPPFVCGWQPNPLEAMPYACPMCGHAAMAHVGCKECPVCVLVMQSTPAWRRQQARIHGLSSPY